MSRTMLVPALAALLTGLLLAADAHAWGAFHAGYTHVGYGGVQHYGYTAARTPYGAYAGGRESAYGAYGGAYHAGYGGAVGYGGAAYGGYRAYTPTYSTGYAAGGYHYGEGSYLGARYAPGVYRLP